LRTAWDRKLVVARAASWVLTIRVSGAYEVHRRAPFTAPARWDTNTGRVPADRLAAIVQHVTSAEFRAQGDLIADGEEAIEILHYAPPYLFGVALTWGSPRDNDPSLEAIASPYLVDLVRLLVGLASAGS
jgi:hypothetical protein